MVRLTDEQRKFIIEFPDYPSFVIAEAFQDRFGFKAKKERINELRLKARGTTNKKYGRGLTTPDHRAIGLIRRVDWREDRNE